MAAEGSRCRENNGKQMHSEFTRGKRREGCIPEIARGVVSAAKWIVERVCGWLNSVSGRCAADDGVRVEVRLFSGRELDIVPVGGP